MMPLNAVLNFESMKTLVEQTLPGFTNTIVNEGAMVYIEAETFDLGLEDTYFLGAIVQIARRQGAMVAIIPSRNTRQISKDQCKS